MRSKKTSLQDQLNAKRALDAINPDDSDQTIAAAIAEVLTTKDYQPPYRLGIFHDVRSSTAKHVERIRKYDPDYQHYERYGSIPLEFDWQIKNTLGIRTLDRERARQWAITALLYGYDVFSYLGGIGGGGNSIKEARGRAQRKIASLEGRRA